MKHLVMLIAVFLAVGFVQASRSRLFGDQGDSKMSNWGDSNSAPSSSSGKRPQHQAPATSGTSSKKSTGKQSSDSFFDDSFFDNTGSEPTLSSGSTGKSSSPETQQPTSSSGKKSGKGGSSSNKSGNGSGSNTADDGSSDNTSNKAGKGSNNNKGSDSGSADGSGSQGALALHNQYRARHGVPALSWSSSIASTAQAYANQCVFEHSSNSMGENLAQGYGSWSAAIAAWYNEESGYDYAPAQFSHSSGHFTQMVWKSSTQLGCGMASCSGSPLYVCNYSPAGNVQGRFKENVPRPTSS